MEQQERSIIYVREKNPICSVSMLHSIFFDNDEDKRSVIDGLTGRS